MTEKLFLLRKQSDNEERPEAFKHSTSTSLNEIDINGKFLASGRLLECHLLALQRNISESGASLFYF